MTDEPEKRIAGAFSTKTNVWGVGCIMQHRKLFPLSPSLSLSTIQTYVH